MIERMKVSISDLTRIMTAALKSAGYAADDIPFIIDMYLGGELRGHTSHGLASFPGFLAKVANPAARPEVVLETSAFFMIDAKSGPGVLIGKRAADEAMSRAEKGVIGFSMIKNMDSWLRPGAIAGYVADHGYLAIVVNSGGGAAIAPPGGFDPVAGTNPIAYAIPTAEGPLVVDMATSKRAWGQVRLANKYGTYLPSDTYYDNEGNVTLDPKRAHSVMSFGDYKGFSLALLFEIMCGSLVGMPMMVTSTGGNKFGQIMPGRGAFIFVIDPEQTTGLDVFQQANSDYLDKIKATRSQAGQEIRIPGVAAAERHAANMAAGFIDIPEELWQEITAL
jgi:L-2-hydroxycarboxylate dehydrogenase (NAD+)